MFRCSRIKNPGSIRYQRRMKSRLSTVLSVGRDRGTRTKEGAEAGRLIGRNRRRRLQGRHLRAKPNKICLKLLQGHCKRAGGWSRWVGLSHQGPRLTLLLPKQFGMKLETSITGMPCPLTIGAHQIRGTRGLGSNWSTGSLGRTRRRLSK